MRKQRRLSSSSTSMFLQGHHSARFYETLKKEESSVSSCHAWNMVIWSKYSEDRITLLNNVCR